MRRLLLLVALAGASGCGGIPHAAETAPAPAAASQATRAEPVAPGASPEPPPLAPGPERKSEAVAADTGMREVFPHVMVDAKARVVRFDGIVPIDAHDRAAPWVFLEVSVCTPDTKEHEALVVTTAKASHVHAALLLIGLEPGSPGKWTFENGVLRPVAPTGPEVRVFLTFRDSAGAEKTVTPEQLVANAATGERFGERTPGKWVFAGSQIVTRNGQEWYDADGAGTLVGLTTFGSETIAWSEVISHEAAVQEPAWIADARVMPPAGTPITVTIRPAE